LFAVAVVSLFYLYGAVLLLVISSQSFYRYNSFKNPIAASDIVQAATALTEIYGIAAYSTSLGANPSEEAGGAAGGNAQKTTATGADGGTAADGANGSVTTLASTAVKITSTEAFYEAYYCLGMRSDELMQKGIQAALDLQRVS
jgi:hypothetical protein